MFRQRYGKNIFLEELKKLINNWVKLLLVCVFITKFRAVKLLPLIFTQ